MTRKSYESQIRASIEVKIPGRNYVDMLTLLVKRGLQKKKFYMNLDEENTYMMFIATFTGILMKWCTQPDNPDNELDWEEMVRQQMRLMIAPNG